MNRPLNVHFLPSLFAPEQLRGSTAVVIDVLRATTVITQALASGAKAVVPCLEVEEARQLAAQFPAGEAVLGGERGGVLIEGFDLGNSPCEYSRERVAGRTVVFTTTNGTKAMHACRNAERVLLAAFVNLEAVCRSLESADRIDIVCAGTGGAVTREDILAAGAIIDRLGEQIVLDNDSARIARDAWQAATGELEQELRESTGGRNLQRLGLASDIADVAAIDSLPLVPELDLKSWRIKEKGTGSVH